MDNIKNFGGATLAAGIAAGDTSASVISGQGARLESTGSWSAVIWNVTDYGNDVDAAYWAGQAELVRVTRTGDSLTLVRAQEGTVARNFNAVGKSYRIKQTLSAYVFAQKADAANGVHTGITQVDTLRVLGRTITPVAVMSGTVVDVASVNNYKALSANTTFTWSAVPATDSWFGGRYRNTSGSPITVQIPTCWSQNLGQDINSFVLQPGQRATIRFYYDGTDTEIHADPITVAQAKAALNLQQSDISGLVSALSGKAASSHTHTASETTDFASAARAQVEAMLTAGSGMTLTPSGSGASRLLALISSGGGGGAFEGQITMFLRADAASVPVGWAEVTTVADYEELMYIRYDSVAPTVTGVTSAKTNGSYTTGEVIDIEVTFSKAVVVTGAPQLTLNVGSSYAVDYFSGSGTATLTFRYTVQSGHTSADLDYASTSALALNGGTIKSLAKVNATLTLAAPGASGSLGNAKALVIGSAGTSFTDTFVRADSNPMSSPVSGGTWTNGSTNFSPLKVLDNLCSGTTAAVCVGRVATPSFSTVQRATITIYDTGVSRGPVVRMQSSSNASGYLAQISNDNVSLGLYRMDDSGGSGTYTQLGSTVTLSSPIAAGDTVSILANGTTLTVYVNGVLQITQTDATYSGGQPGIFVYGNFKFASQFVASDS